MPEEIPLKIPPGWGSGLGISSASGLVLDVSLRASALAWGVYEAWRIGLEAQVGLIY